MAPTCIFLIRLHSPNVYLMPTFSLHLLVPQTLVVKFLTLGHLSHQSPMPKTYLAFKGLAAMLCFFYPGNICGSRE